MTRVAIGQIAGVLAFIQIVPYIISILRGRTKPERTSYLIWLIVELVSVTSYIAVGATTTIWTGVAFCFTALLVFLLSIKYGVGGFSIFDLVCLIAALAGVVLWISSKDPILALYFITSVKVIGYLPTIKKVYFLPNTENKTSWILTAIASVLNLGALTTLAPNIVTPVLSAAILQSAVVGLLILPNSRFIHSKRKPHKIHLFLAHPIFAKQN